MAPRGSVEHAEHAKFASVPPCMLAIYTRAVALSCVHLFTNRPITSNHLTNSAWMSTLFVHVAENEKEELECCVL